MVLRSWGNIQKLRRDNLGNLMKIGNLGVHPQRTNPSKTLHTKVFKKAAIVNNGGSRPNER